MRHNKLLHPDPRIIRQWPPLSGSLGWVHTFTFCSIALFMLAPPGCWEPHDHQSHWSLVQKCFFRSKDLLMRCCSSVCSSSFLEGLLQRESFSSVVPAETIFVDSKQRSCDCFFPDRHPHFRPHHTPRPGRGPHPVGVVFTHPLYLPHPHRQAAQLHSEGSGGSGHQEGAEHR